ncbi:winged helix-turn-helix transcriptional regulator [Mobilicoccus massiliensis]|uniref:winged helix-turn-helix transcriptional regulator n=1 Tax=Mobilicoccus massiliensis TaxID=1522310 RepID=UPI001FE5D8A9|nr:helix-turn-helix domain-containing protein [Mobilicoccus massiliensis]
MGRHQPLATPGATAPCTDLEDVMSVLGRAWAGAILEAMLAGHERFRELARAVPGVTDSVLSARLKEFCARGLAERMVDPGPPSAVVYRLTEAGRDVAPVLTAVRAFGAAHPEVVRRR